MECKFHPNKSAEYRCEECGAEICADCAIDAGGGVVLCKRCAADALKSRPRERYERRPRRDYRAERAEFSRRAREGGGSGGGSCGRRLYGGFWFFIFNAVPGGGYMYLGLIKRGMAFMAAFFAVCVLASGAPSLGFLGCAIPIIYFVAFFDGLKKMRLLNDGVDVPDDADDMIGVFTRNKGLLWGLLALCVFSVGMNFLERYLFFGIAYFRGLFPILLLAGGLWLLIKRGKSKGGDGRYVYREKKDEEDCDDFKEFDDRDEN